MNLNETEKTMNNKENIWYPDDGVLTRLEKWKNYHKSHVCFIEGPDGYGSGYWNITLTSDTSQIWAHALFSDAEDELILGRGKALPMIVSGNFKGLGLQVKLVDIKPSQVFNCKIHRIGILDIDNNGWPGLERIILGALEYWKTLP